jgi:MYXO-CTERM domain-containing protein
MSTAARASLAACAALALAGCSAGDGDVPSFQAPAPTALVRPDTPGNTLIFRFEPSDVVETFGSKEGHFLVHFTRQGPNAVPAADADSSGTPDFVEDVASVYEEVLKKYHDDLGFRAPVSDEGLPDNGGDGRFDVYLVDFAGMGDGNYQNDTCGPQNQEICAGYMVQENDFTGYGYPSTQYANRILGSHEFFHAVQAAYDKDQGSVMAEGTAVWATEQFDPTLKDFEGFLSGYLDNPDRPLDQPLPGPVDPFSYGSAIFFEFLEEHYGAGTIRSLWERCENGANGVANPVWLTQIDPLLASKANASFVAAMTDFAEWNLFTGSLADPARSYKSGAGYPAVKMNVVTAPYYKDLLRVYYASAQYYRADPAGRTAMTAALVAHPGSPDDTTDLKLTLAVKRGNKWDPLTRVSDVSAGTETIATDGADAVVAIVINTATSGNSRRPALCLGTTDEVDACRKMVTGSSGTGTGGAGGGGGGTGGGGGGSMEQGGCGCQAAGAEVESAPLAIFAALGSVVYRRRRRARKAASARPIAQRAPPAGAEGACLHEQPPSSAGGSGPASAPASAGPCGFSASRAATGSMMPNPYTSSWPLSSGTAKGAGRAVLMRMS